MIATLMMPRMTASRKRASTRIHGSANGWPVGETGPPGIAYPPGGMGGGPGGGGGGAGGGVMLMGPSVGRGGRHGRAPSVTDVTDATGRGIATVTGR